MSKGGNHSFFGGDMYMSLTALKRLIQWLDSYGIKPKSIKKLLQYITSGDKRYLP